MKVIPSNGLEILEFDKVIALIKAKCISGLGRMACADIAPSSDVNEIVESLEQVGDALGILNSTQILITAEFFDVEPVLTNLKVQGYVVEGSDMAAILTTLKVGNAALDFFEEENQERYGSLFELTRQIPDLRMLIVSIEAILDEMGKVKPNASPVLQAVARQMRDKRVQGDRLFQRVVKKYGQMGWLADTLESVRNERRVLAVKAEFKRKIRGIVHDQSASGRTAFVEPEEVIELNNDLFELDAARRAEEYRLLSALSDEVRPYLYDIRDTQELLTRLDLVFAKARLARQMNASIPILKDKPRLGIGQGYHPLLYLKNQTDHKTTVPFDLDLHGQNRILLVSGPNAGGKSIMMKSTGLLQVMLQSGIPIPVDPTSEFGVFKGLCVELGDQQSIENDLSTYSSRLVDMTGFLEVADQNTLVLIDEFGSGTDPKLGGAIAEGILDQLNAKKVYGVITTHYSELKVYAFKKKGIVNGAMIFDKENMVPTYKLRVGKPGSSFTFEIAERTGLPKDVIEYAKGKAGKNTKALEDLLSDLEKKQVQLESQLQQVADREQRADTLIKNYETLQSDLAAQRKRFKLEQKERDYQHLSQMNKELERAVRTAREKENAKEAKAQLQKIKKAKEKAKLSILKLNTDLEEKQLKVPSEWKVGDPVKVAGGTHTGRIERIDRKVATIIVGQLRMNAKLKDLRPAKDPLKVNATSSIQSDVTQKSGFNPLLDMRGMRYAEAHDILQKFLDDALLAGVYQVRIVHGKGTGALRKLVDQKATEYPTTAIEQPEDQSGQSGETIITF